VNIAVLLSGGVDSSVALARLRQAGQDVTAFYLKIWLEEELAFLGDCPWQEDLEYARAACATLDVALEVVPLQTEYQAAVVAYTLGELTAGRTPSPDLICNRDIKFGAFVEKHGGSFDAVATGHYARVRRSGDRYELLRGADPVKDQSYFLAYLSQRQLASALFPLGTEHKSDVRAEAREMRLATSERKDSQGICFLGNVPYQDFVRAHLGVAAGAIRELQSGRELGQHRGHWFHTIGQRQGLGLGDGPWYVAAKDVEANTLWVAREPLATATSALTLANAALRAKPSGDRVLVRIRHGVALLPATVRTLDPIQVELDDPQAGVAYGQFAVLYDGEVCLGCGVISAPLAAGGRADLRGVA
jgi:tRNA-specific 2-thiouridylase